jgi:hypothetical protein
MKWYRLLLVAAILAFSAVSLIAQTFNEIGGFEQTLPAYWTMANQPSGSTLSWATDQFRSLGHSLKIVKTTTGDSASWISTNMCDIWSPNNPANVDILLGAYIMTSGVNTNPANDSARWWVSYTFYDSAGTFIGETKLPINQTTASSGGWVADTNAVGATVLPRASWKTIVKFVAGQKATGTVWADDFLFTGRGGAWAGQDWNTGVGVPTGWYYWLPPNGGNDALLGDGFENTVVTNTEAHSGSYSLMFNMPFNRTEHDGYVGTQRFPFNQIGSGVSAGDVIRISVWIKANNLVPDSAALYPGAWAVGFTPLFFSGAGNNFGYNPVGPQNDYTLAFPTGATAFDWTQYSLDVNVPTGVSASDLEVRLHVYARFTGQVYFDDLTVEKLDVAGINQVGGFEGTMPAYWNIGNSGGGTLTWATDQFRSLGHSLKIVKTTTTDSSSWISSNMCDIWSPNNPANVDILCGAYIKTSGVNINPANDSSRWWISYTFYDSAGTVIGETKLPIDQSAATSAGWEADTNAVGATVLPRASWKTIVKFVAGQKATGTVWADDFVFYGRGGAWAGQDWNTGLAVPQGWYYWLPPNGGNDGLLGDGFENTLLTNEQSHSGNYSLKFDMPFNRTQHDGYVGTQRFYFNQNNAPSATSPVKIKLPSALDTVKGGDVLQLSVWLMADSLVPDSAALYPGAWAVGLTPLFFSGLGNNFGYNPVGPQVDYTFAFPTGATSFGWTQYSINVTVPTGVSATAMEVRLHVYSRFTGRVYFDDLSVTKLDAPQVAAIGGFEGTLPAYWNMGNQPAGSTLSWATDQGGPLGHSLKIVKSTTSDSASWISSNMCDIWSPNNPANVDILVGAYIKTSGVNVNPANDSAKWWVSYSFYDSSGTFIGETKLPIDQSVATNSGWEADTNGVGATVLPRASWKTIVKFVAGQKATGTVWADNFVFYGRGGAWAGQDWNTSVGVPQGFYYWLPPNGGNDGLFNSGFENTRVTSAQAHSGSNSLMFDMPFNRATHDGYVATQRYMLDGSGPNPSIVPPGKNGAKRVQAKAGDVLHISVWVMADSLVPDSAALYPGTWAVGFTPLFFAGTGNNYGYNPVGPQNDYTFTFPAVTSFGWTQYSLDVTVPTGVSAAALEVRLHVYARFTGRVYFDDLNVQVIGSTLGVGASKNNLPKTYALDNNYPNPFNPTTTIQYAMPKTGQVSLVVYNILGQQVRSLLSGVVQAGYHNAIWDSKNDRGLTVPSGMYFYRLSVGNIAIVKKMLLIK